MPAASCRIIPARSISLWDAISASFGVSRRMGRKYRERRMKSQSSRRNDPRFGADMDRGPQKAATAVELQGPMRLANGARRVRTAQPVNTAEFLAAGGGNMMTSPLNSIRNEPQS